MPRDEVDERLAGDLELVSHCRSRDLWEEHQRG